MEASVLSAIDKTPIDTRPRASTTHTTPGGSKLRGPAFDFSQNPTLFFELRKLELAAEAEQRALQREQLEQDRRAMAAQREQEGGRAIAGGATRV